MQTDLAIQIKNSLHDGLASASWLIVGAQGVGKRKFALNLAKKLTGIDADFNPNVKWLECDLTETAKKDIQKVILSGQSVENTSDYSHKTEITVDDVRSGCQFLSLKSENLKVLIINLADEMNENAQNALLKTLEEPYPNTLILLLCENVGKLLPTILSRCQIGHIRELSSDEILEQLKQKYPEKSSDELKDIVDLSAGSIGMAEKLITKNGLMLYHTIENLCVPIKKLSVFDISAFYEQIVNDNVDFDMVKYLISTKIAKLGKERALVSLEKAYDFSELYRTINEQWQNQQILNLDKKQVLFSVFYAIGEVIV